MLCISLIYRGFDLTGRVGDNLQQERLSRTEHRHQSQAKHADHNAVFNRGRPGLIAQEPPQIKSRSQATNGASAGGIG